MGEQRGGRAQPGTDDQPPAPGFLRWRSWGAAARRALLLHDGASSASTWWLVAPALAESGWRVKAPDLPSHGASARAGLPVTPELAARAVARELSERPLDLLVGHGFGAAVALELLRLGGRTRHLVLYEPLGQSLDWSRLATRLEADATRARQDSAAMKAELADAHPDWSVEDVRRAVDDLARCAAAEVAAGLRLGGRWAAIDPQAAGCPTLVLAAATAGAHGDPSTLSGADRAAAALIADAVVEFPGGHSLHRERPREWLDAVQAFIG